MRAQKRYKNHADFSARYCCVHRIVLEVLSAYWFIFWLVLAFRSETSLTAWSTSVLVSQVDGHWPGEDNETAGELCLYNFIV